MKIDRHNPRHWLYLAASALWVLVALVLRPFRRRRPRVLLYGHKLGGNLLAIHRHLRAAPGSPEVAFLTLDPAYHRELRAAGEPAVLATSPRSLGWLATADALVSDHGLHTLQPLLWSDMKFFDVWHGIPFKGFDAGDFRVQHKYDEAWVASPMLRELYIDRFGFDPERVVATGYARTDRLVRQGEDVAMLRARFGLPSDGPCILFAPTWKQDADNRSLYPFGMAEGDFLEAMAALCERHDATLVLRTHLNSGSGQARLMPRVVRLPYAEQPDTEGIMLACDVLVCDWSSIAFDWLLLDRPALFLDVEAPFARGLSLDASHRYGALAGDMASLVAQLDGILARPRDYWRRHRDAHALTRLRVYGDSADGHATGRCVARLARRWGQPPAM